MNKSKSFFDRAWAYFKEMLPSLTRFILVGVGATLVHYLVGRYLSTLGEWSVVKANVIGFIVAFIFSFCGHYYFTFRKSNHFSQALIRFFIIALSGFAANNVVLLTCLKMGVSDQWAFLFAVGVMPIASYIFSYFWAFKAHQSEPDQGKNTPCR